MYEALSCLKVLVYEAFSTLVMRSWPEGISSPILCFGVPSLVRLKLGSLKVLVYEAFSCLEVLVYEAFSCLEVLVYEALSQAFSCLT